MGKSLFIDLGEKEVHTYLFDSRGSSYTIRDTRTYPVYGQYEFSLPDGDENAEHIYLSLPLSCLNFRVIELPFSDRERIREVLPFELEGMILTGADRVIFDNIVVGSADGKYKVLAVYIEKDVLKKILDTLRLYGIDPAVVTCLDLRGKTEDFRLPDLLIPPGTAPEKRIELSIEEMKKPVINLRREEFSYTRDLEQTKRSLRVTAALMGLLILVLSATIFLKIVSARSEVSAIKNSMRKEYRDIFPEEKKIVNELYQLRSRLKELRGKEDVFVGINPLDLLLKLSAVERQGIVFNEITEDKVNIVLKGEAESLSDIQHLKDRLRGLHGDVAITDSGTSGRNTMLFTITAKEKRS
jgi:type II secretory pathway component PulL